MTWSSFVAYCSAAGTYPGASEVCDGADNDCDGAVDEGVTSPYYAASDRDGIPRIGGGGNTRIENTIVDKNARIGDGCGITPEGKPEHLDGKYCFIRDGIVIIPKNAVIPDGTVI